MEKESYAVCKLPEEGNDVINVCSGWLVDGAKFTMYPPRSQGGSLKKLLKSNAAPLSTWNKYPVTVMGYYDTFEKAEEKVRKACETSNLESSDDEEMRKSRNKRKRKNLAKEFQDLFGNESSDAENYSPTKKRNSLETRPTPKSPPYPPLSSFSCNIFPTSSRTSSVSTPPTFPTRSRTSSISTPPRPSPIREISFHGPSPLPRIFNKTSSIPSTDLLTSPTNMAIGGQTHQSPFRAERGILNQIQITLADLCAQQRIISEKLEHLTTLQLRNSADERQDGPIALSDIFGALPLPSNGSFEEFEAGLDDLKAKQLVKLMTSLGGKDQQQSIHNMLRRVMTDQLASTFSFSGKVVAGHGKAEFRKTKICKCILGATQKLFGPREATENKFANIVGKWLQQAKTRVERRGKNRRAEGDVQRVMAIDEED